MQGKSLRGAVGTHTKEEMAVKSYSMSSLQGIMALDSPYTGIVDWRMVALRYGKDFEEAGGTVVTESEVNDISMAKESPAGGTEGNKPVLSIL